MDHPNAVTRLVIVDGLPVVEHLGRLNEVFVRTWWHWWFFGQTVRDCHARRGNLDSGRSDGPTRDASFVRGHAGAGGGWLLLTRGAIA
jgi:hypothetical protein